MDPSPPVDAPPGSPLERVPAPTQTFYSNIKTPRKARSSSQPKSNSTPISNKTAGNHPYASQVVAHDVHNEALAQEMEMRFVGPMPPRSFFRHLLGLEFEWKTLKGSLDLSPFEKVARAQNEPDMHQKFVEAMEEFIPTTTKNWQFVNSASQRDAARDGLGPDVPIYGPDAPSGMKGPDFSRMDSFIEFKFQESADPFIDKPKERGAPPRGQGTLFEQISMSAKEKRGQLGSYVAAIAGSQFRLRVFAVLIFGSFARLMCWDRAGAVVTEKFDYTEEPFLAQFFLSYCSLDPKTRGHDPTVRKLTAEELDAVDKLDCLDELSNLNGHHYEFRIMEIPDRVDATEYHDFLISYPPKYSYRSPFGRATRPMRAYDMRQGKVVFVKDYWRPNSPLIDKEGDIYESLESAKVPYIAPFGVGNDVKDFVTQVDIYRDHFWACDTVDFSGLILYRMSLDKLGSDLVEFQSTEELARVISHAMTAHDAAYYKAKILHRDISAGNILIDDEGDGFLIDWDLCIRINDDKPSARRAQRTGTWQFISAALLRDPQRIQTIEDDRESAVHVLTWLALRYTEHSGKELSVHLEPYDEVHLTSKTGISTGGGSKGDRLSSSLFPIFASDPLNRLLIALRDVFSARYGKQYSAEQIKEARDYVTGGAIDATKLLGYSGAFIYGSRMDSIKKPNWLVEVFNEHLDSNDWPLNDKAEANSLVPGIVTSQKRTSQQAALEERAQGSNSKQRMG